MHFGHAGAGGPHLGYALLCVRPVAPMKRVCFVCRVKFAPLSLLYVSVLWRGDERLKFDFAATNALSK